MSTVRPSALITVPQQEKACDAKKQNIEQMEKKTSPPADHERIHPLDHRSRYQHTSKEIHGGDCRPDRIHNAQDSQHPEADSKSQEPPPVLRKFAWNLDQQCIHLIHAVVSCAPVKTGMV
jgi:hypothetical protein